MALLENLIRGREPTTIFYSVNNGDKSEKKAIPLDALISEAVEVPSEITEHPVEDDADISDHVIIKPRMLKLEGKVTTTPFTIGSLLQGAIGQVGAKIGAGLGGALGSSGSALGAVAGNVGAGFISKSLADLLDGSSSNRLDSFYKELMNLRTQKVPVEIVSGFTRHTSYIMGTFSLSRDNKSGQSLKVAIQFKELIVATSKTERIPVPKERGAVGKQGNGRQVANETAGAAKKKGSLLFEGLKGVGLVGG